jgi:multiple sugar transport system permease protein
MGTLFIGPWAVGFLVLQLYPFLASLYWSFTSYDLLSSPEWVGLANYRQLAGGDPLFLKSLWNTAYYTGLSVPVSILASLGLALLLNQSLRGRAVYRTIFFLPSIVPAVAAAALWIWLLDPKAGMVNYLLGWVGVAHPPGWFNSEHWSKPGLVLMAVWGAGNFMIIYLASLSDMPAQLYEAAEIDGATRPAKLLHITLPMLSPVIFFNLVMGVIASFQYFTQAYVIGRGMGDPVNSTRVYSIHLFLTAFKYLDMGYASAMAWTLFLIIVTATWMLFRTARHWVFYLGEDL